LIRNTRACGSYYDFLDRVLLLTRKPLSQRFLVVKLNAGAAGISMECSDSTFGIFKLFLLMENIFVDKDKSKITTSMKIS
jgi:hypothetical protein